MVRLGDDYLDLIRDFILETDIFNFGLMNDRSFVGKLVQIGWGLELLELDVFLT